MSVTLTALLLGVDVYLLPSINGDKYRKSGAAG